MTSSEPDETADERLYRVIRSGCEDLVWAKVDDKPDVGFVEPVDDRGGGGGWKEGGGLRMSST